MKLGVMFFSHDVAREEPYQLLLNAARIADISGFNAVWTPERHFDRFGGAFADPAITSAALAIATRRIGIRAGSVVAPLHDSIRLAENWAMIDRLSGGRVAVAFAAGWHPNDFVFHPGQFADRYDALRRTVEEVRQMWRTGTARRPNGVGQMVDLCLYPRPLQAELPVWIASTGSPESFRFAGRIGANVITHLTKQTPADLEQNIALYRSIRKEHGFESAGTISLMLHTYVAASETEVRRESIAPLRKYIASWLGLEATSNQDRGGRIGQLDKVGQSDLLDAACEKYFNERGLLCDIATARERLDMFTELGVDEIACLIDFGISEESVLRSLDHLGALMNKAGW